MALCKALMRSTLLPRRAVVAAASSHNLLAIRASDLAGLSVITTHGPFTQALACFSTSKGVVDAALQKDAVVVFMKSYCHFCKDLLERLEDADVPHAAIELDSQELVDELRARTQQKSAPFFFLKGSFIPAEEAMQSMKKPGMALKAAFEKEGVPCKGYFRS